MSNYSYKVVPFIGQIKSGQSAVEVSKQLQAIIDQAAKEGWEFYQLTNTNIEVQPGCLAGLVGTKASYVTYDQVIFRKSK
jgi:hypothetical protein